MILDRRMAFPKTEQQWAERAVRFLKAELKRADVTYDELADRLKQYGFGETRASVANKLARATMSAHFLLASLAAIQVSNIRLDDL
jgi:Domain of unknown function (DUF6471)